MRLTKNNYFSPEAEAKYYSASQIKAFLKCPAASLYDKEQRSSTALLIGSYVDAAFTNPQALADFKEDHPEIFNKRTGELKAEYIKADEMISRARSDKLFMSYLKGRKQVIKTGTIGGYPFKIRMDFYRKGERIVDLKTAKDLKPAYKKSEGLVTFAELWEWPLQMAIYQEIEGNRLPCYLAVITKEDPPDLAIVEIPQEYIDLELSRLRDLLPRFDAIKKGMIPAPRCECCSYCRRTKKITGPVMLPEFLDYGG